MSEFPVHLVKSRRRSVAIKVNHDLSVEVRVPLRFKASDLDSILDRYHHWISKKRDEILTLPKVRELLFLSGELVPILGKDYPVVIEIGKKLQASFTAGTLLLTVKSSTTEDAINKLGMKWYRGYAMEVIESRVAYFLSQFKKDPTRISIKSMKSRWGSCSTSRSLNFNWKLVMAPLRVLDYVVIHEMCHMIHMDHSHKFWAEVEKRDPDYKLHKLWLRKQGRTL